LTSACERVSVTGGQFSILGVTFASPPPAAGAHSATLTVTCNDPDDPSATVTITGTL
jgi:hypothetical protein